MCDDEVYTSCHNNPGNGEVRVLDLHGNLRRRLGVGQDGAFMFRMPYYFSVNKASRKVFVSDLIEHSIICMTVDGCIIYKYHDVELKAPQGLCCDSGDNILVCSCDSHKVQVIAADGKKYGTLLSQRDGIYLPQPITYKHSDDTLIIGCYDRDRILLFKLRKQN